MSAPTQVQSLYISVSQQVVDNKKGKGQPEGILLSFECKLFILTSFAGPMIVHMENSVQEADNVVDQVSGIHHFL